MDHLTFAQLLGNYGEFVGAIAVVVTLGYLAVQIRHNMRTARASTYQQIYRDLESRLGSLDLELRDKLLLGADLSENESRQWSHWLLITMRAYENWWQQHRYGILDDEIFEAYISHMRFTLGTTGGREVWSLLPVEFCPGFVEFVDEFIRSTPTISMADAPYPHLQG